VRGRRGVECFDGLVANSSVTPGDEDDRCIRHVDVCLESLVVMYEVKRCSGSKL
jgi:hypothetical protein